MAGALIHQGAEGVSGGGASHHVPVHRDGKRQQAHAATGESWTQGEVFNRENGLALEAVESPSVEMFKA